MTSKYAFIINCKKCLSGHLVNYPLYGGIEPIICRGCKKNLMNEQKNFFKTFDLFLKNWDILFEKYKDINYKELIEIRATLYSLITK